MRDATERLVLYYSRRGLKGNSSVLEWLIGRKPTSHAEWTRQIVEGMKAKGEVQQNHFLKV